MRKLIFCTALLISCTQALARDRGPIELPEANEDAYTREFLYGRPQRQQQGHYIVGNDGGWGVVTPDGYMAYAGPHGSCQGATDPNGGLVVVTCGR